jgi:diadenosine tetraphosphate (Ap4A) HIT family hydrolase
MLDKAKDIITLEHNPDGYNIGMNCGIAAGQTVMQLLSFNTKIYR